VFPSKAGHFFLKVHDSLKPGATIVKLGRVHGELLGERSDLQCDQIIDLAPKSKEALLGHRISCSNTLISVRTSTPRLGIRVAVEALWNAAQA
jgi:hypothetical protein